MSKLGDVLSKLEQLERIPMGVWGQSPQRQWGSGGEATSRWAIFCNFIGKKAISNSYAIGSNFARAQSYYKN